MFWDVDFDGLEVERHANFLLARVLEFGDMPAVRWLLATYGEDDIHRFFRDVGHPELSARTIAFWRAYFRVEDEPWANLPGWRKRTAALWPD